MALTVPDEKDRPRESGTFAWIVVIALGLMSAGTTGTYSIIAGSFVAPVCEDLGFEYTSFSFYFTAILLGLALGLPLLSRFIPKVIGKPVHICVELVLIAAGAAMAFYTEVWMFIVSAAVIGICFSFTTGACMSDVIDQWFSKSSGLAIGLAWGVNSLCTLLLNPVITLVIEQQGWRTGYIVLAAVSAAMILPASALAFALNPLIATCFRTERPPLKPMRDTASMSGKIPFRAWHYVMPRKRRLLFSVSSCFAWRSSPAA